MKKILGTLLLLCVLCGAVSAQSTGGYSVAFTQTTSTFDSTGATAIVLFCESNSSSMSGTPSDNKGNSGWVAIGTTPSPGLDGTGSNFYVHAYIVYSPTSTGTGHTVTCPVNSNTSSAAVAVKGTLATSAALDAITATTGASASVTTTQANDILILYLANDQYQGPNHATAPTGSTGLVVDAEGSRVGLSIAYQIATTAGTYSPAWTTEAFDNGAITVALKNASAPAVPSITSPNSATFTVGSAGSFSVTASNTPTSYAETGTLPSGVTFNTSTGALSGTPAAGTGGTYTLSLTATNSGGTSSPQTFTLTVNQAPAITSANSKTCTQNASCSFTATASGYPAAMTWSETGTLPTGMSLNTSTGVLSGTPTNTGSFPITLSASNGVGSAATQSFTITVTGTGVSLTVSATGTGSGSWSGTNCATNSYTSGTTIGPCTATAATGSTLGTVSGTGSTSCSASPCASFSLTATSTLSASFTLNSYTISKSVGSNGSMTCPTTVAYGSTGSCTVTPNSGYVASVGGCGGAWTGASPYTWTQGPADCTVTVTFSATSSGGMVAR